MPYETPKEPGSKRSLIEFGAILRRNGCGHKPDQLLCRVCGEELSDQIETLGDMMIKARRIQEEMDALRNMIPRYMFNKD